jgi:hypothetical protein
MAGLVAGVFRVELHCALVPTGATAVPSDTLPGIPTSGEGVRIQSRMARCRETHKPCSKLKVACNIEISYDCDL